MTFFDCTADLVGQLNGNGQKGTLQIDAPPVENFWLRHWSVPSFDLSSGVCGGFAAERPASRRYRSTAAGHPAATAPQHGAQQQMRAVTC